MELDEVADALYALPPGDFTSERDARARAARDAGDKDLGEAIKTLRRPTTSAWLVNQLARQHRDQIDTLLDLGAALREAQGALSADQLRSLAPQRQQVIHALTREARRLAAEHGEPVSDQVEREVESTLQAALADPGVASEVRTGRLTRAITYAGLGPTGVGPTGVGQVAPRRAAALSTARAADPDRGQRERAKAEEVLAGAEAALAAATDAADRAGQALDEVRQRRDDSERAATELERQLERARHALTQARTDLRDAERRHDVTTRARDAAERDVGRARTRLASLGD
jgi:chromosome segregation ATPase